MIKEFKFDDSTAINIGPEFTIFCDMDGTLVDTDYANYLSYRRATLEVTCGTHDIEFTDDRIDRESLKKLFPPLTTSQLEIITALKTGFFMEFVSETRLNTALAYLIKNHCGKNTIALVTCCRKNRAVEVLKHHKLFECFSRLICWEDLPQGSSNKYENAIKLTGISQENIFIFENDNSCIEEAVLAGVPRSNISKVFLEKIRTP